MCPEVGFEGFDFSGCAAGASEVVQSFLVDRKEAHRCAILRRHVGDGGAVRHAERPSPFTIELHEFADHLVLAQDLGDGQNKIGGGHAFAQTPTEFEANDIWCQEVNRLAQHGGLGFDAADTPADHADAVDHGGVAVGTDQGVRIDQIALAVNAACQIFQVDLMHDAEPRRYDTKGVKGLHAPFDEFIALAIALEFELHVEIKRIGCAVVIDHDGVIDNQIHRNERFDLARIVAQTLRHAAHGSQIGKQGHAGKILQNNARDSEGDFFATWSNRLPLGKLFDVFGQNFLAVAVA